MKIESIERSEKHRIFIVKFKPNCIERLFGVNPKVKEFKDTGAEYIYGGGTIYITSDGNKLGNGNWIGEAIDKWRCRF